MGCLGTKTVGWLFLVLLLSSEAIELNRRVNIAKFPSLLFHGDAKAHIDRLVADFEGGFGAPDGEGSGDELTPKQIIDIQNSLRESLSFEGSPVLFELDTMTPAKLEASASDTAKYKYEISDILRKSTEPLNQLISLLETVTASKKTTARHSWGRATSVLQQATAGENVAQGDCERTTALTCGRNEECVSSKNNPCKGFCQCNIDGVSNCECVKEVTFSGPFAASLDDEKNIDQAFTIHHSKKPFFRFAKKHLNLLTPEVRKCINLTRVPFILVDDGSDGIPSDHLPNIKDQQDAINVNDYGNT